MRPASALQVTPFREIIDKYDTFFFDCDGVLWEEEKPIKPARETLSALKKYGKEIIIVTNTTNSRKTIKEKLQQMLKIDIDFEKIYASSYLTALYLKQFADTVKKVYVIGKYGLVEELKLQGFDVLWAREHDDLNMDSKAFGELETDEDIGAVVCGFDPDINFYKISYASICLQKGALFVVGNVDANSKNGKYKMPGGGTMVTSLAYCAEKPPFVTGKPNPFPIDHACEVFKLDKRRCIMVGDNLKTDIPLGYNASIDTCLLLTGITTEGDLKEFVASSGSYIPHFYSADLSVFSENITG